jgi:hypothetical protein
LGRAVEPGESPVLSSDKALRAFLIHLAEETRVSERSARLYLNSRGLKTTATAQRFLEGFEALYALRPGHVVGVTIRGSEHERVRQVTAAFLQLGRHLRRAR